jgi:cytochrome c556
MTITSRFIGGAALLLVSAIALQQCSRPAPPPPAEDSGQKAYVSIREIMTNIIDPLSDNVFDAVGSDVTEKGIVDTKPTTDEDWARVKQGAVALAEGTNLLKIPRRVAPAEDNLPKNPGELPPDEIQKKIDADPAKFYEHANAMRDEALKVLDIVKARDADKLFEAGSNIDKACETCHLEYWYPGDREAVLKDRNSKVFIEKPAAPKKP